MAPMRYAERELGKVNERGGRVNHGDDCYCVFWLDVKWAEPLRGWGRGCAGLRGCYWLNRRESGRERE